MTIAGLPFIAVALAGMLLPRLPALRAARIPILTALSLAFAALATASLGDAACLAAMAATGWIFIRVVATNKHRAVLVAGIACVLAEFLLSRQILPRIPAPPWLVVGQTIGLSYIMFRVIHLIVDRHGDEIGPGLTPPRYICYLFCYLTFLAGPIQRVEEFLAGAARPPATTLAADIETFLPRIAAGYLNYTIVAGVFFALFTWSQNPAAAGPPPAMHAIGWLAFAAYLYTSFAGYSTVMLGFGGLTGLPLPRNFDRPWATTNFLDFWSRWHISLSEWFKLYVFSPLVKDMIAVTGDLRFVPLLGAVGYFVTFFLMGLWHGLCWRYVLYGICLGAGVSANKLYQAELQRRLGKRAAGALVRRPLYATAARTLALTFFIVVLGFLWLPAASLNRATWPGWAAGAALTCAGVGAIAFCTPLVAPRLRAAFPVPALSPRSIACLQLATVVIYVGVLRLPVPPLLYQFF